MLQLGLRDGAMLASDRPQARQAIEIFTFRISGEMTGGDTALMQSHSPQVSVKTSRKSAWRSMPAREREECRKDQ
jgi:hypothetical protein